MLRPRVSFGCALLALFVSACAARSEHELQAEFRAYVAAHDQCASTQECVLASAGCPLGCVVAVNAQHQSSVERKARELVDEYESSGRSCAYECAVVEAACSEGHCQLVPR